MPAEAAAAAAAAAASAATVAAGGSTPPIIIFDFDQTISTKQVGPFDVPVCACACTWGTRVYVCAWRLTWF